MGLIDLLKTSIFGFKGEKPKYDGGDATSTLHYQSSINNKPSISKLPSILDEDDSHNTAKYRSTPGERYIDKLPK